MKLLVIDVQKGITDERLYMYGSFIQNVRTLIHTARDSGIEVIFFQHDDGPGSGFSIGDEEFEIDDRIKPVSGEKVFVKTENSCFTVCDFVQYLQQQEEDTLMIAGLQTDYCIDATVKSASERGYSVFVPEGANSSFDNALMDAQTVYRYFNELIWPDRYASCIDMEKATELLTKQ